MHGRLGEMKAMGFQSGDELVKINDELITGLRQIERLRFTISPGQALRITVRRARPAETPKNVEITIHAHTQKRRGLNWVLTIVLYTILPGFSLALGFIVAFSARGTGLRGSRSQCWLRLGSSRAETSLRSKRRGSRSCLCTARF